MSSQARTDRPYITLRCLSPRAHSADEGYPHYTLHYVSETRASDSSAHVDQRFACSSAFSAANGPHGASGQRGGTVRQSADCADRRQQAAGARAPIALAVRATAV
eukprot:14938634-Heterocapsa_arctica.AAC.1